MKIFITIVVILALIFGIAYLITQKSTNQKVQHSQGVPPIGKRIKVFACIVNGALQDLACTPGAVFANVTAKQVCVRGYAKSVRNVSVAIKREVYAEYGIKLHTKGQYEVDHLVSLELGGSNDIANLWPETALPQPGFHEKDKVENYLHAQVCSGRISLQEAQREIAYNWLNVYKRMGFN